MRIREASAEDLPRLLEIYNHYVDHTPITFDVDPIDLETRRRWIEAFAAEGPHRLFVVEDGQTVQGYASSGVFRAKAAYARSVETSIYLAPEAVGEGRGSALYGRLIDVLAAEPTVHRAYAGVTLPNEASLALHARCGFKLLAHYSEVGFKFGRYWDVAWLERAL